MGFIGAGKAGVSLGKYFSINNIPVSGFYDESFAVCEEAAEFTHTNAYNSLDDLIKYTDIIYITTPDNVISYIWDNISCFNIENKIICHASGSLSSHVFRDAENFKAYTYSIHPIYAFSDRFNSYKNLKNCYFSIEGDTKYLYMLESMLHSLGNPVFVLDKDCKPLYHLACVTASNLVLSLLNIACSYLESCGFSETDAFNALLPLIENNIDNIHSYGFKNALTGPLERGDTKTLAKHISVIPKEDKLIYKALCSNILKLAEDKHPDRDYDSIKNFLKGV